MLDKMFANLVRIQLAAILCHTLEALDALVGVACRLAVGQFEERAVALGPKLGVLLSDDLVQLILIIDPVQTQAGRVADDGSDESRDPP